MPPRIAREDCRFLVSALGGPGDEAELPPGEAHHLTRVLRLGPGDRVALFDGRGRECLAEVASVVRSTVRLRVIAALEPAAEPRVPFALVQAVLKGPAMEHAVRDAVMIGAASIVPIVSSHVAVKSAILARPETLDRWRRIALASTRQCRRAVLPPIEPPVAFDAWLGAARHELRLILVEPSSADAHVVSCRALLGRQPPASAAILIGPEGGWTREEVRAAVSAGCTAVSLGSLTLRAETMALAAGAIFRFLWED
jgi:16S rRNA (uracil1498-N3)-methyltransferase